MHKTNTVEWGDGKISSGFQYIPEINVYDYDGKAWRWTMSNPLRPEKIEKFGDLSALTERDLIELASFTPVDNSKYVGFVGKNVYSSHEGTSHISYINNNMIKKGGVYYDSIRTTSTGDLVIYDMSNTTPLLYYKVSDGSVISMPTSSDLAGVTFNKTETFETDSKDSNFITITKASYDEMIKHCKDLDMDALKEIKNLLTASTVTSGISAAGGIANTVMGGISIANNKSNEDKSATNAKFDMASTIVSGVTAATSGVSTATSAVAISKVNKIIDQVKDCNNAVKKLILKAD